MTKPIPHRRRRDGGVSSTPRGIVHEPFRSVLGEPSYPQLHGRPRHVETCRNLIVAESIECEEHDAAALRDPLRCCRRTHPPLQHGARVWVCRLEWTVAGEVPESQFRNRTLLASWSVFQKSPSGATYVYLNWYLYQYLFEPYPLER